MMRRLVWVVAAVGVGCSNEPLTKAECLDRTISALNDADFDDPKIDRKLEAIGDDLDQRCPTDMMETLTAEETARIFRELDSDALLWLASRDSGSSGGSSGRPSSSLKPASPALD